MTAYSKTKTFIGRYVLISYHSWKANIVLYVCQYKVSAKAVKTTAVCNRLALLAEITHLKLQIGAKLKRILTIFCGYFSYFSSISLQFAKQFQET